MINKHSDLSSIIDDCAAEVVVLTKTRLSSKINDSEILHYMNHFKFASLIAMKEKAVVCRLQHQKNIILKVFLSTAH